MWQEQGGFTFENHLRNQFLLDRTQIVPMAKKTGTTIAAVVFKDGVVLGADTRATSGSTVADKNCAKIHYIAPNIYCCGAGTSADTENVTEMISRRAELQRFATGRQTRIVSAMTMLKRYLFQYQGHVGAYLILGGVDPTGPHLCTIHAAGSVDTVPYVTMGSGSLAAMAVFESGYKDDLTMEEAKALVHRAISAGIFNDLGSGGNVDLCVITKDKVDYLRNYDRPNERQYRNPRGYTFPRGASEYISETVIPIRKLCTVTEEVVPIVPAAAVGSSSSSSSA